MLYLRVWAQNSPQGSSFTLCVINTSPPVNDNCADAIPLTVGEEECVFTAYSNQSATAEPGIAPGGCGFFAGGDVWFTFVVPASGLMKLDLNAIGAGNYNGAVYSGTCGNFQQLYCINNNGFVNIFSSALAGETLYLRVYRNNAASGGLFELCAGPIDCPADLNFDGLVNASDLSLFLGQFGCSSQCTGDFNNDGVVNSADLSVFLSQFGTSCGN